MRPDQVALRVAARQHGVITRQQGLEAGLTADAIRYRCAIGRWERVGPGVYRIEGSPSTWEQRVTVGVLAVEASCASHLTAGHVLAIVKEEPELIDVTVRCGAHPRTVSGVVVHRARALLSKDVRTIRGIPTTCPARTLVDIAGVTSTRQLARTLDRALLAGITSVPVVWTYVTVRCLSHNRGVGELRRLLEDRKAGVPEGDMERAFLDIVRRYRLPSPIRQQRVGRYRLDFAYPEAFVAIELDDLGSHGTPGGLQSDLRRQNRLTLLGWQFLRFTWADVTRAPGSVAATIRKALCRTQFSS